MYTNSEEANTLFRSFAQDILHGLSQKERKTRLENSSIPYHLSSDIS